MKAVSSLSLEPRVLLWLFKVEEAKGNCLEQLCVCVCVCVCVYNLGPLRLSGLFSCIAPYPSASQIASPLSG